MATDRPELMLTVPADLTRRSRGLSIDMGGSVLKFVYRTKEDFDQVVSEDVKLGRLRLVSFPRDEVEEGLEYIRQRVYFHLTGGDSSDPLTIYTTGVGCTEYGKLITETLNVRLENLTEFECFSKAFHYLATHAPRHVLLEPFLVDAIVEPIDYITSHLEVLSLSQAGSASQALDFDLIATLRPRITQSTGRPAADGVEPASDESVSDSEADTFPCLLAMCGSGFAYFKIERDGSFRVVDGSNRGGRCFVGVGMLLTGCKSFDELIDLASKGNAHNVDQYTDEIFKTENATEDDQSLYTLAQKAKPGLVFCFGKAGSGQDQFRREDIAAAWLQYILLDFIQSFMYACLINNVKRAFFSGGFTSHPLIRHVLTKELARRNMSTTFMQTEKVDRTVTFDFVKPGQHLGALGCLIHDLN